MDMVWEFKQELYVSQQKVSRKTVADLSNPTVRTKLQTHINSLQNIPESGAADEYAALFERVYPSEADRSSYIKAKIAGAKPSYGHLALATLMRAALIRIVWTTNFDPLLADACAKDFRHYWFIDLPWTSIRSHLAKHKLLMTMSDGLLKSNSTETSVRGASRTHLMNCVEQDENLRKPRSMIHAERFGLVVVGYSGRDDSVMDALDEAAKLAGAFPEHGLFWLHRGDTPPLPRVCELLNKARRKWD